MALLFALATVNPARDRIHREADTLVLVTLRPRVLHARDAVLPPRPLLRRASLHAPTALPSTAGTDERPVVIAMGVGTMVPHPGDTNLDTRPFAQRAGLVPGTGATVVLRLQVLGSGEVSDVRVEVSGGSEAIDQAAIAYAKALPWVGGELDGRPVATWIRWGVRLEA